jgi:hypothetical protein
VPVSGVHPVRDHRGGCAGGLDRATARGEPDRYAVAMIRRLGTFGCSAGLENNIATLQGPPRSTCAPILSLASSPPCSFHPSHFDHLVGSGEALRVCLAILRAQTQSHCSYWAS